MAATFMNSAMVLSIGIFFSLIIVGLAGTLPGVLYHGLSTHGVPASYASRVAHLPPVGSLFAAFLGYNPIATMLHPVLGHMAPAKAAFLTGHRFFPSLVAQPFATGIHEAFYFAAGCCLVAAIASWMRGAKYVHTVEAPDQVGGGGETPAEAPQPARAA